MELRKIQGHTYYCPGPTNIGVIRYKNGMAMLIDGGIDSTAGRGLAQAVESEGLKPKYIIVTHAHPDHFGAVKWLKENYTGLLRYASEEEALWMQHPVLESRMLYGASPLKELESRFLKGPKVETDFILQAGLTEIGEKRFEIIPLAGHTYGQIGVITSDSVLFAGDSLFSEEIMEKYSFPFLMDVEQQLETIKRLQTMEIGYTVLSHGSQVYSSIANLCKLNKQRIETYLEEILNWCSQPLTREDVTDKVLEKSQDSMDVAKYHMALATVGAFLAYLANRQELEKSIIGGRCYFYRE